MTMELRVSSYGSRAELEAYCERLVPEQKEGLIIIGTVEELRHFQLSPSTTIFGIACTATDFYSKSPASFEKPMRMPNAKGYGLNGNLTEL